MKLLSCIFIFFLCFVSSRLEAQDSIRYYSVNTFGKEFGEATNEEEGEFGPNDFYLQSLYGIKLDDQFGIAAGLTFIYNSEQRLLPLLVSIRKSPINGKWFGYNLDIGYVFPLSGNTDRFEVENYRITKGGLYFNPEVNMLFYDGYFLSYLTIGYRTYRFTEKYENIFFTGSTVEDVVSIGSINIGVTFEF